jgi:hypothetical protein
MTLKRLLITSAAVAIILALFPEHLLRPSAGVPEKISTPRAKLAANSNQNQQTSDNPTLDAILTEITKNEQETSQIK